MTPDRSGDRPEYNVYRSGGPRLFRRSEPEGLRELRQRQRGSGPRRPRKPISWGRVVRWILTAALAWLLLSAVVFLVSAQLAEHSSSRAEAALSTGGSLLSGSTVLVLGSDARPPDSKEPGAGGPARADSIMLLHVGFGSVRKLSILRDSQAAIPGHGTQKINASYALGGAGLAVETIEQFLGNGLEINHVIEVNFENFPDLIDALGGVDVKLRHCVHSNSFGGRTLILHRGKQHLNGRQALMYSRVRKNKCRPNEDDRARARRQQEVLQAIRGKALSPATFIRLPWVAWAAPRTVRSDLRGPGLSALFGDLLTGGAGPTRVLKPSGANGSNLVVSDQEKAREVRRLLAG